MVKQTAKVIIERLIATRDMWCKYITHTHYRETLPKPFRPDRVICLGVSAKYTYLHNPRSASLPGFAPHRAAKGPHGEHVVLRFSCTGPTSWENTLLCEAEISKNISEMWSRTRILNKAYVQDRTMLANVPTILYNDRDSLGFDVPHIDDESCHSPLCVGDIVVLVDYQELLFSVMSIIPGTESAILRSCFDSDFIENRYPISKIRLATVGHCMKRIILLKNILSSVAERKGI